LAAAFKRDLPRELDYKIEAANAERCRQIFKHDSRIKVPEVYHEYTRERVLVMSCEIGTPVTHVKKVREQGINLKDLSNLISEAFNHMIFKVGFVHGDPHPGNLFARKDENGKLQLVILDHGIYTDLGDETRLSYNKMWRGILS
jgi:aarF domain-containing kinase